MCTTLIFDLQGKKRWNNADEYSNQRCVYSVLSNNQFAIRSVLVPQTLALTKLMLLAVMQPR